MNKNIQAFSQIECGTTPSLAIHHPPADGVPLTKHLRIHWVGDTDSAAWCSEWEAKHMDSSSFSRESLIIMQSA